jgi:radical SAM/Cys-rich protein
MSATTALPSFASTLKSHGLRLERRGLQTVQVNLGKLCNLACTHCHVEAGPGKTEENMDGATVDRLIELLQASPGVRTLDLTGGAPEMNPHFRRLVTAARAMGKKVLDRCNLTVLFLPGQEDLADFLAGQGVEIVASLPCYTKELVEKQRGKGVFDESVAAIRRLNELGYGVEGSGLVLDLVYNPVGPSLPPDQAGLEKDYRGELGGLFGLKFNRLFTITNMVIKRYAEHLRRRGALEQYQDLLIQSFNPATVEGLMCRDTVSVDWRGRLYDCDFNQQLDLPEAGRRDLWSIDSFDAIDSGPVLLGEHCYGCTAGQGSSCGGALDAKGCAS